MRPGWWRLLQFNWPNIAAHTQAFNISRRLSAPPVRQYFVFSAVEKGTPRIISMISLNVIFG